MPSWLATGASLVLDIAIAVSGSLALLSGMHDGLRLFLGLGTLSVRDPFRPLGVLLVLLAFRSALARRRLPTSTTPALTYLPFLVLVTTSVAYWLLHLTTICGGADSYGYVSAAVLLGQGTLSSPQPDATWLPAAHPLSVLTPLAFVPRPADSSIVPLYPLGFPALIAAARLLLPADLAPYLVAPAMALVVLILAHRLARRWTADATAAWLATCLVAWDPLVVTYAKQPMSDIPAAAWLLLAVWLLVRDSPRPLLAGLAAGASFMTRPGGLGAVAAVGLLAAWQRPPVVAALARFAAGVAPWVALQAVLQWRLFGSPWQTGYGSLGELYAGASLIGNALVYARALGTTHMFLWVPLVLAGLYVFRRSKASWILILLGASVAPYLLYFRFDHWETLRFILPAVVILDIAAAAGAAALMSRLPGPLMRSLALVAVAVVAFVQAGTFLRQEGVPTLMEQERRYTLTAEWLERHTPPTALVFAGQHSGSIRHYAGRTTLRWDLLHPGDLEPVVREARRRGRPVFAALDRAEQPDFHQRFASAFAPSGQQPAGVSLLPGGQVRDVQIWELTPRASSTDDSTPR